MKLEIEDAFVDVAGRQVHYLHAGAGAPMLLIHGLVGSSEDWRGSIQALAEQASVYAIDLVNMGKSQRVEGLDASLKATASRIVAIMDALGLGGADVVAHSYGGAVALMLAARYPRRVRRLILFAPANPYSSASDTLIRLYSTPWGGFALRMLPYLPVPIQRRALGDMYGGPEISVRASLRELSDGLRQRGTARHVLTILRSWFTEMARLRRALRRVTRVPTLLVWGDQDHTVSLASGVRLQRKLHASELVVMPGGGHSAFAASPDESNRILLDWLERHPLSAARPATFADRRERTHRVSPPDAASGPLSVHS